MDIMIIMIIIITRRKTGLRMVWVDYKKASV